MNDDIVYISGNKWLKFALDKGTEIVGTQFNLASILSPSKKPLFIRTSAFGCNRKFFLRLWEISGGNPQTFEKNTLNLTDNYSVFDNPFYIYDSNLKPFVRVNI